MQTTCSSATVRLAFFVIKTGPFEALISYQGGLNGDVHIESGEKISTYLEGLLYLNTQAQFNSPVKSMAFVTFYPSYRPIFLGGGSQ